MILEFMNLLRYFLDSQTCKSSGIYISPIFCDIFSLGNIGLADEKGVELINTLEVKTQILKHFWHVFIAF